MRAQLPCSILAFLTATALAAAQDVLPPGKAAEELPPPNSLNAAPASPAGPDAGLPEPSPAPGQPVPGPGILSPLPGPAPAPPGAPQGPLPPLPPGTTTLDGSMVPGPAGGDCCTLPDHIAGPGDGSAFPAGNLYYPATRFWVGASYIHWWARNTPTPPLLSISPTVSGSSSGAALPSGVPSVGVPGVVVPASGAQASNAPLLVGSPLTQPAQSGGRFTIGYSWDPENRLSVEGDFLFLGERSESFRPSLASNQTLSRPFLDAGTGAPSAFILAAPGVATGSAVITGRTEFFGGEANVRYLLWTGPHWYLSFLTGARALELNESVEIDDETTALVSNRAVRADVLTEADRFSSRNFFYGGQAGLDSEWACERAFLRLRGKLAAGVTHQIVNISGATTAVDIGGPAFAAVPGGLLTQPGNIGHYSRDRFSVVPEIGVDLGYWVTQHARVALGYTCVYWTSVARVGDQIDRGVNSSAINTTGLPVVLVGPARPTFFFRESDFWVQGVNFTLELRY